MFKELRTKLEEQLEERRVGVKARTGTTVLHSLEVALKLVIGKML